MSPENSGQRSMRKAHHAGRPARTGLDWGRTWMLGWASRTPIFRLGAGVGRCGVVVGWPSTSPCSDLQTTEQSQVAWSG